MFNAARTARGNINHGRVVHLGLTGHEARLCMQYRCVCLALGLRARAPEAGDRHHHERWVTRRQRFVAETPTVEHTRAEVLHHHIGLGGQTQEQFRASGRRAVHRDAPLTGVHVQEHSGDSPAYRAEAVCDVAVRPLHLHHVGTEIGQYPTRHRASDGL